MTSRDRCGRNAPDPGFVVPGEGPLARLLADRLGCHRGDGGTWVHVAHEPGEGVGAPTPWEVDVALEAAGDAGAAHVVVVSSAMVLGPAAGRPLPLPEDEPVTPPDGDPVVDRLRALEHRLAAAATSAEGPRVHVLRPAVVVGPGLDSPFVRHFAAPRLLSATGSEVAWQFCHVDDLAAACRVMVEADLRSATVGAPGFLDALDVTRICRRRRLELPEPVLLGAAERLRRVGVAPVSEGMMRHLVQPWPVAVGRLPAAGWAAAVDNATCLAELLEVARDHVGVAGRLVPRREAAVGGAAGAAGVTVAALGAAVLLRRSRRRGGGRAG